MWDKGLSEATDEKKSALSNDRLAAQYCVIKKHYLLNLSERPLAFATT